MVEFTRATTVGEAAQQIIALLEDNLEDTADIFIDPWKPIYFDGWHGWAASTVLRAIAEDSPTSLKKKFDNIIHIDCSRWKSRRSLQRTIVEELELPQHVMAILDREDKEDDFSMVDEGFRHEIEDVAREIHQALQGQRCLVIFHNGSNDIVDLSMFGIPDPKWSRDTKILWTFGGWLLEQDNRIAIILSTDPSHNFLQCYSFANWEVLLREGAREIARCTHKLSATSEIVAECCLYLLSLTLMGGDTMGYNWDTHAYNYWVCDGIINGDEGDEAWEVGSALHQELQLHKYMSSRLPYSDDIFRYRSNRWIAAMVRRAQVDVPVVGRAQVDVPVVGRAQVDVPTIPPESSSFFLASSQLVHVPTISPESSSLIVMVPIIGSGQLIRLPKNMFQQSEKLRVLKLYCCTFSFSLPPFRHCLSLRFLAIDSCKDRRQEEVEQERPVLEFFGNLWVLDICQTDWELDLSSKIKEQMATNIREVHIKRGRIWRNYFTWRRLQNLRKLLVIEPTCSWESGNKDEFTHMVKLELLNLSGNCTIQVLPSLSEAACLRTLILDGCIGLEHVGPNGLPLSLESFSLDAGSSQKDEAKVSKISLVGCVHLKSFTLHGALPCLEELDLSGTSIRKLNLSNQVVRVPKLERIFLEGCEQLLAIRWWREARMLKVLRINNQEKDAIMPHHSSSVRTESRKYDGEASVRDARFIQSLMTDSAYLISKSLYLYLGTSSGSKIEGEAARTWRSIDTYSGRVVWPVRGESLIPIKCCYSDVLLEGVADVYEVPQLLPLDYHVEIGDGMNLSDMSRGSAISAAKSLIDEVSRLRWYHTTHHSLLPMAGQ